MTGFGRAEVITKERKITVELKYRQSQISGSEYQNAKEAGFP